MKRVVIESPLGSNDPEAFKVNVAYAKQCVMDSLERGEAPYASHVFFAQDGLLNDQDPNERRQGMEAGFAWGKQAELCAVYVDNGFSPGMREGIRRAKTAGIPLEFRSLDNADANAIAETMGVTTGSAGAPLQAGEFVRMNFGAFHSLRRTGTFSSNELWALVNGGILDKVMIDGVATVACADNITVALNVRYLERRL